MSFESVSGYDESANFNQVIFHSHQPLTEAELNEVQQIQNGLTKTILSKVMGNFITNISFGVLKYSEGYVTGKSAPNRYIVCGGYILKFPDFSIKANIGDIIYVVVWEEEVDSTSELKQYGYVNNNTLTNKILDERVGVETSHRVVVKFDITTVADTTKTCVALAQVVDNGGTMISYIVPTNVTLANVSRSVNDFLDGTKIAQVARFIGGFEVYQPNYVNTKLENCASVEDFLNQLPTTCICVGKVSKIPTWFPSILLPVQLKVIKQDGLSTFEMVSTDSSNIFQASYSETNDPKFSGWYSIVGTLVK